MVPAAVGGRAATDRRPCGPGEDLLKQMKCIHAPGEEIYKGLLKIFHTNQSFYRYAFV